MNVCIPYPEKVITRYAHASELPRHDLVVPGLYTGAIHITLKTETPLCVGDTTRSCFYQDADGCFAIPSSTLRGMLSATIEILGLSGRSAIPGHDYRSALLGFAAENKNSRPERSAYKSRISFSDLQAEGKPRIINSYVIPGFRSDRYDGLKVPAVQKGVEIYRERGVFTRNPQMLEGKFAGSIRFKNLQNDELGLLLWSILLEKTCFHTLGQAKSFGFGRVSISVNQVVGYTPESLYCGLKPKKVDLTGDIDKFIQEYKSFAEKMIGQNLLDVPTISAFLDAKSLPPVTESPPASADALKALLARNGGISSVKRNHRKGK